MTLQNRGRRKTTGEAYDPDQKLLSPDWSSCVYLVARDSWVRMLICSTNETGIIAPWYNYMIGVSAWV